MPGTLQQTSYHALGIQLGDIESLYRVEMQCASCLSSTGSTRARRATAGTVSCSVVRFCFFVFRAPVLLPEIKPRTYMHCSPHGH